MANEGGPGISFHALGAGGRVGELIREKDWSPTPLGPRDSWPRCLNNYLSMIFELPTAAILFWGPDQIQLYNDGYSVIMGPRHPRHLGSPFRECWPEAYASIYPWMERVLRSGETVEVDRTLVPLTRFGFTEEAYFTFSFSPLRDDQGKIAGILQLVTEVTEPVLAQRRTAALREISNLTAHARAIPDAVRRASEVLGKYAPDFPFSLLYLLDPAPGRTLTLSGSSGAPREALPFPGQIDLGADEPGGLPEASRAVRERDVIPIENLSKRFGRLPAGPWPEAPERASAFPIATADQMSVVAVWVAGLSPRLAFDTPYRGFLHLVAVQLSTLLAAARAHEDERRRTEALAEINRAKTEFFSNVSHEFRTPLTLMLGPIEDELAETEGPLPGPRRERLLGVHRNSVRLLKLVNSLLEFSRIEAGRAQAQYAPTDLARYTAELASSFTSAMDKAGLRFTIDCPTLPEPAYVDPGMWEKIVLNLISNAFKHTFQGEIAVRLRPSGEYAELSVSDTGVGISAADQERLFDRFHRVRGAQSRSHEGSGIGLALVKELAALHGGTVSLESQPGKGSTFTVRIRSGSSHLPQDKIAPPAVWGASPAGAAAYAAEALRWVPESQAEPASRAGPPGASLGAAPVPAPDGSRPRILLADDNPEMREYITRLLGDRYEIRAVADGRLALQAAREEPRPELVLSDVMMPNLDGFGLLEELRKDPSTKTLPVILLSARAGEESSIEGLYAGADDYLVKPFSARELRARVRTHLEMAALRRTWALELERSNRELEAFSYSVAHDLRAPLRAIDGYSHMLLTDHASSLDAEGHRKLRAVSEGAKKMGRLIEDLLSLSRLGRAALDPIRFDMTELAREVMSELVARSPGRKIQIALEPLGEARGDRNLLRQVWVNLIGNAIKYTGRKEEALIQIGASPSAKEATYWIKDNGAGFDMEHAQKLFGVFQRLHSERDFEGTGIGLTLVKRIVTRHGGRVWAEGAPEAGATFSFALPLPPRA